jgi:hypothetical protein
MQVLATLFLLPLTFAATPSYNLCASEQNAAGVFQMSDGSKPRKYRFITALRDSYAANSSLVITGTNFEVFPEYVIYDKTKPFFTIPCGRVPNLLCGYKISYSIFSGPLRSGRYRMKEQFAKGPKKTAATDNLVWTEQSCKTKDYFQQIRDAEKVYNGFIGQRFSISQEEGVVQYQILPSFRVKNIKDEEILYIQLAYNPETKVLSIKNYSFTHQIIGSEKATQNQHDITPAPTREEPIQQFLTRSFTAFTATGEVTVVKEQGDHSNTFISYFLFDQIDNQNWNVTVSERVPLGTKDTSEITKAYEFKDPWYRKGYIYDLKNEKDMETFEGENEHLVQLVKLYDSQLFGKSCDLGKEKGHLTSRYRWRSVDGSKIQPIKMKLNSEEKTLTVDGCNE